MRSHGFPIIEINEILYFDSHNMRERKVWNEYQDKILKYLKQERGEKKWSVIARKMEQEFQILDRTGKQCRERYHNHLDSGIVTTEWRLEQDDLLFALHDQLGNKWSSIAQSLHGRSDNCVKNHFYSKLRKSARRLNKFIVENLLQQQVITSRILSKIIQTTELKFKMNSKVDEDTVDFSVDLKNRLYRFQQVSDPIVLEDDIYCARQLVEDIFFFERNIKKPGKAIRKRKNSFDQKSGFLHPKSCINLKRSNSRGSQVSDISESSYGLSSSNLESLEDDLIELQIKPRKRSMTTRTSKEILSRNNSEISNINIQDEARSIGDIRKVDNIERREDITDQNNAMWEERLSTSLIEEYPSKKQTKRESHNSFNSSRSNSSKSYKSNRSKIFKSFDQFCEINEKMTFHFNFDDKPDPISEIIWRVIEPKQMQQQHCAIQQEEIILLGDFEA